MILLILNLLQRYNFFAKYANFRLGKIIGKVFLRSYLAGKTSEGFEDKGLVERRSEESAAGSGTERGTGIGARERMTDTIRRKLKNLGLYIYRIKGDDLERLRLFEIV